MSDDDIDLDRVITDPSYRRQVIEFLNGKESGRGGDNVIEFSRAPGDTKVGKARPAKGSDSPQG
jgi:hypothetical protein